MDNIRLSVALVFVGAIASSAMAFNPPEDADLPLYIRIDGPAKVMATDSPIPVHVVVENRSGDARMEGSLRLEVIDAWRVESGKAATFSLKANESVTIDATITASSSTYNALYPLHAYADATCGQNGHALTAHAVLLMETQTPNRPRPNVETVPWQPMAIAPDSECLLLRLPCFRALIQVLGEIMEVRGVGWHGVDGRTRTSIDPFVAAARPDSREAIGIHPPWHQGLIGSTLIEYPLELPAGQPIHLRYANAIRDTVPPEPPSDGVTFRVRVAPFESPDATLGDVVYERHTDGKTWQDADVDLSAFAGKVIRLQLESHPGPRNDTTCDQSYWAAPVLIAGTPKPASAASLGDTVELGNIGFENTPFAAVWRPGARGMLDGELAFTAADNKRLAISGFRVRVAGSEIGQYVVAVTAVSQTFDKGLLRVVHHLRKQDAVFDLVGEMRIVKDGGLEVRFSLENVPAAKPWNVVYIEDVSAGPWSESARRIYAGVGNVIEDPQAFDLYYDSHQLATSVIGYDFANGMSIVQSVDVPPARLEVAPVTRHYTLHAPLNQTIGFHPANDVWQGARARRMLDTREAAGGVAKLAGRFVFDLWGGRYGESAEALKRTFRYGLTDSAVVWHNWQCWGYDYRLPNIAPPNPEYGTLDDFRALASASNDAGVIFAPHDNYIDFYPDADDFSYQRVAFTRDAEPVRAWLNEGRGAQSYRWRTDAYWPFMEKNIQWLRTTIAPTGYFIDVFSSIGPYESWTFDGQFQDRLFTRDTWGKTFAWIREQLGNNAPQISEGGHDQLVGYLDGGQCNHLRVDARPPKGAQGFTWTLACADAERIPWLDMLLHDRFVAHGAGYDGRFRGGLEPELHGIFSDDYMSVEMLDGHPAMVPEPFSRNVVRKYWLLHGLGRALALQSMNGVAFDAGNIHRTCVEWQDGARVWVNRGPDTWNVEAHELPQYGFYASAKGVAGAIERREGVIVEWSRSQDEYYVNARAGLDNRHPISIASAQVEPVGDRKVRVTVRWRARQPTSESLMLFGHFVDDSGKILFQADMQPPRPTDAWQGDIETVSHGEWPADAKPGDAFELRVGMYRPDIGRIAIRGSSDDQQRVRLGSLRIENQGATWTPLPPQPDPFTERGNPEYKMIHFDGLATNGGARMAREGEALVVTPLPDQAPFTLAFDTGNMPFGVRAPARAIALAEDGTPKGEIPLHSSQDTIALTTSKDVFAYRLEP